LAEEEEPAARDAEAVAPHLDLALRLLAGDVEDGAAGAREQVRALEDERALPDPRLAADEHHLPGDDPAAEDAVELADAGGDAVDVGALDRFVGPRPPADLGRPPLPR